MGPLELASCWLRVGRSAWEPAAWNLLLLSATPSAFGLPLWDRPVAFRPTGARSGSGTVEWPGYESRTRLPEVTSAQLQVC